MNDPMTIDKVGETYGLALHIAELDEVAWCLSENHTRAACDDARAALPTLHDSFLGL